MFTGIVEEIGRVADVSATRLAVAAEKTIRQITLGDSIGVNGVCLTVAAFDQKSFTADVMQETMARTALKYLKLGDAVNLEGALTLQKPLGGHLVQGHVDDVGEIESLSRRAETTVVRIAAPRRLMRYVVEKGFIAVDGMSLTVVDCDDHSFAVSIVNYTWDNTRLSSLEAGDMVNLEADIIAKYVERFVTEKKEPISPGFLKEHGFTAR